jgi:ABC-2 type transport system ATP-binding protein
MMTSVSAVAITKLRVVRGGRRVLDAISCQIAVGSVTGLLGPSGCGKSTLMRAIVGVQVIESGDIRVLGEPAGSTELRRRVGYVTQAPSVYADLSVRAGDPRRAPWS